MNKIGISTCGDKPTDLDSFRTIKAAGMDAVEICMNDYRYVDFKRIKADADASGIELFSYMLPSTEILIFLHSIMK